MKYVHDLLEFDDFEVLASQQITKLLRLQQITGGFIPTEDEEEISGIAIPGPNPKLSFLMDAVTEDYPGKAIIWARFRFEIKLIADALRAKFGVNSVVELHGGVTGKARENTVDHFQALECMQSPVRLLVGQQASGIGITLHAAKTVFYYSNPFSYEQRYQSEDRAHRIGLKHPVVYIDLVSTLSDQITIDGKVIGVLHKSRKMANEVTGDDRRKQASKSENIGNEDFM